jgi:hypothetical protein
MTATPARPTASRKLKRGDLLREAELHRIFVIKTTSSETNI